jgi:hypothetical protein
MSEHQCVGSDVKRLRLALKRLESGCNVLSSPDFGGYDFEAERAGRCLDFANLHNGSGIGSIG